MNDTKEEVAAQEYVKIKISNFSANLEVKKFYLDPLDLAGKQWFLSFFF